MIHTRPAVLAAATLALAAACAESKEAGTGSGVRGSKTADKLTSAEARRLCHWSSRRLFRNVTVESHCILRGVSGTSSAAECRAFVETCKVENSRDTVAEHEASCDLPGVFRAGPGCSKFSVDDYESCIEEAASSTDEVYLGVTCENPGEVPPPSEYPSICKPISRECPELNVPMEVPH